MANAMKSSNVANTLLQTLQNLTAMGDKFVVTKETAKSIETLAHVCIILVDSAETVAESTGDPEIRDRTFQFAKMLRDECQKMGELAKEIHKDPNNPQHKPKLLEYAKNVANYTTGIVTTGDDVMHQRVVTAARDCARAAKAVALATSSPYDIFFEACKQYGSASLTFARTIQELGRGVTDRAHLERLQLAYNNVREMGPQLIRLAKRVYENPSNKAAKDEIAAYAKQLTGKIAFAISVSQPDGGNAQNEIGESQPVVPIPQASQELDNRGNRRRTVNHAAQGVEILSRARTATVAQKINEEIEEASIIIMEVEQRKKAMATPTTKETEPAQAEQNTEDYISAIEEDLKKIEVNQSTTKGDQQKSGWRGVTPSARSASDDTDSWKSKYEQAQSEISILKEKLQRMEEENKIVCEENENLNRLLESMRKRLDMKK